jgi:hypothetical protein
VAEDRQRNRGFFSGLLRGVSDLARGSENRTFLSRPRLVRSSLLHLLSSGRSMFRSLLSFEVNNYKNCAAL